MAAKVFSKRDGELRLYDATGTPNYVVAKFDEGDLEMPFGPAHGEIEMMTDKDKAATATTHWMKKSDKNIFEPYDISFSGVIYDTLTKLLLWPALSNPDGGTWTVGASTTFVTQTSIGSRYNLDGTSVTCPVPTDSLAKLVNVEYLLDGDSADMGRKVQGVHWLRDKLNFSAGTPCKFKAGGKVYGAQSFISSFTAGTEVTS